VDISLFSAAGALKGQVNLKEYFGDEEFQGRTLHEVVTTYQRNERSGTSMTKTRGLVRGGGRKPWKQKGTGNARAGSIRSPLWRKGGIIFGPVPRSFQVSLPEVKRRAALKSAVWLKAKTGAIVILEQLDAKLDKTQKASVLVGKVSKTKKTLILSDKISAEQRRAFSNLAGVCLESVASLNALDVMRAHTVVLTLPALKLLSSRLTGASHA
jgi:large subunit ribosomal protein L4